MTFVHAYPGVEELGRVYRPHLAIHAAPAAFAAAAAALEPPPVISWRAETEAAHADFSVGRMSRGGAGRGQSRPIMVWLRENLPADAIVCNGAGNYAA